MSTNKMDIVDGYKGIMDLDLTDVREEFKKDLTIQHQKDIDEYKSQQSRLEPRLRYENTIGRIRIIHSIDEKCQKKRVEERNKEMARNQKNY
jgi:hypothetical protein